MVDNSKKAAKDAEKSKIRSKYRNRIQPDVFIPAKERIDFFSEDSQARVAVYVRVSTDNVEQTTSYELQKNYYEEFVQHHPNWILVKIYADEGKSGTSMAHRIALGQMLADCRAGKIDLIITKSVSRLARDVVDCIQIVRDLAELAHPVGVFFESEAIFSLNEDTELPLSFIATMAQNESKIRSRSMEVSLSQRLNGGLPLTPMLLGYAHDADGNLVINPDEAPTVKLIFYMYLYGYSSSEIADALERLGRKTYLGNIKWSPGAIIQILRNERHCGDVLTRKTFTPNYRDHKSKKNRGMRAQSLYQDHHEAIVTRDDFIAVQHLINNAKYGNKSILPELRVMDEGLLKGFVLISPKWAGFRAADYYQASLSVYDHEVSAAASTGLDDITVSVEAGDFDMRGFEVSHFELFDSLHRPYVLFQKKTLKFGMDCIRKLGDKSYVDLLVNPIERKFAVRVGSKESKYSVQWSHYKRGKYEPKAIPCAAFGETIFELFGWVTDYKYRAVGAMVEDGAEVAFIFDLREPTVFIQSYMVSDASDSNTCATSITPLSVSGKHVRAIPQEWVEGFGHEFYIHREASTLPDQSEEEWKLRLEGQLFDTGKRLNVTGFDELKDYIYKELKPITEAEGLDG